MTISQKLEALKKELGSVQLIAVTKFASDEQMQELINAGQFIFGENRVQVAQAKQEKFIDSRIQWHLIGHLQTNKAKQAVKLFEVIQSIDSIKIAEEVNAQAEKIHKIQKVLVEVNIAKEPQKNGVVPEEAYALIEHVRHLQHVELLGLMSMAPLSDNPEDSRPYFKKMKQLFDDHPELTVLSMGMSGDYKIALQEGATVVRIGTKLFN
jgi:pyridoxal phosphate enzyme (YggS family)